MDTGPSVTYPWLLQIICICKGEAVMNQVVAQSPKVAFRDRLTRDEWRRMAAMFGFIAFLHIAGGLLMWKATSGRYELSDGSLFGWGTAALAYVLGMRHAFDADHISAIDNTTRR